MNIDQLREFCKGRVYEEGEPWSRGDYSYATDRKVLVRSKRVPEAPENPDAPDIEDLFKNFPARFFDLPELPEISDRVACPECNDNPTEPKRCPECNGRGEVFFENGFNPYVCECLSCFGEGEIERCNFCDDTGSIENTELVTIEFMGVHFNVRYLKKISALHGIKFATNGGYGYFTFDEGEGVLARIEK